MRVYRFIKKNRMLLRHTRKKRRSKREKHSIVPNFLISFNIYNQFASIHTKRWRYRILRVNKRMLLQWNEFLMLNYISNWMWKFKIFQLFIVNAHHHDAFFHTQLKVKSDKWMNKKKAWKIAKHLNKCTWLRVRVDRCMKIWNGNCF